MLRLLSSLKVLFAVGTPYEPRSQGDTQTWLTDPLSHPVPEYHVGARTW
ncbi:Uncharacterized protein MLTONO_6723 [Mesorhizobium loti]|nr:Uncharacterized protein MLTONO_6723 [Mesorhizobium loti]